MAVPSSTALAVWAARLQDDPAALALALSAKSWTPVALDALGVGWDGRRFTIPIHDAGGELVNVCRYLPGGAPKLLALPGRPRDLFPAPEALRALGVPDGSEVWIVEGEPDAISAAVLPKLAISVPGAHGWKREYAPRFAGFRVVVLCDNDSAGDALADRVADDVSPFADVARRSWRDVGPRAGIRSPGVGFDLGDYLLSLGMHR